MKTINSRGSNYCGAWTSGAEIYGQKLAGKFHSFICAFNEKNANLRWKMPSLHFCSRPENSFRLDLPSTFLHRSVREINLPLARNEAQWNAKCMNGAKRRGKKSPKDVLCKCFSGTSSARNYERLKVWKCFDKTSVGAHEIVHRSMLTETHRSWGEFLTRQNLVLGLLSSTCSIDHETIIDELPRFRREKSENNFPLLPTAAPSEINGS